MTLAKNHSNQMLLVALSVAATLAIAFANKASAQPISFRPPPAIATMEPIVGQATVIDGDTLEIHGKRIRLWGIDAPESSQICKDAAGQNYRCGQKTAFALADMIARRTVSCVPQDMDRYGRVVAECSIAGANVNQWLVRSGHAIAYAQFTRKFVQDEAAARAEKANLWAGTFQAPSEFRKQK
jgi:endonuclease YncB( thermonuclease family)